MKSNLFTSLLTPQHTQPTDRRWRKERCAGTAARLTGKMASSQLLSKDRHKPGTVLYCRGTCTAPTPLGKGKQVHRNTPTWPAAAAAQGCAVAGTPSRRLCRGAGPSACPDARELLQHAAHRAFRRQRALREECPSHPAWAAWEVGRVGAVAGGSQPAPRAARSRANQRPATRDPKRRGRPGPVRTFIKSPAHTIVWMGISESFLNCNMSEYIH